MTCSFRIFDRSQVEDPRGSFPLSRFPSTTRSKHCRVSVGPGPVLLSFLDGSTTWMAVAPHPSPRTTRTFPSDSHGRRGGADPRDSTGPDGSVRGDPPHPRTETVHARVPSTAFERERPQIGGVFSRSRGFDVRERGPFPFTTRSNRGTYRTGSPFVPRVSREQTFQSTRRGSPRSPLHPPFLHPHPPFPPRLPLPRGCVCWGVDEDPPLAQHEEPRRICTRKGKIEPFGIQNGSKKRTGRQSKTTQRCWRRKEATHRPPRPAPPRPRKKARRSGPANVERQAPAASR